MVFIHSFEWTKCSTEQVECVTTQQTQRNCTLLPNPYEVVKEQTEKEPD